MQRTSLRCKSIALVHEDFHDLVTGECPRCQGIGAICLGEAFAEALDEAPRRTLSNALDS